MMCLETYSKLHLILFRYVRETPRLRHALTQPLPTRVHANSVESRD